MALAFSTTKIEPSTEGFDKLALLEATENLNQAWMDLTEAQRGMDEVCAIMENIHTSVDLINKFGKDAIPMLNVDGGLEALLQIPENVITAEKAMEGLSDVAKSAWEKVKGWILFVWDKIVEIYKKVVAWMMSKFDFKKTADDAQKLTPEQESKLGETPIDNGPAAQEAFLDDTNMPKGKCLRFADTMQLCETITRMLSVGHDLPTIEKNLKDINTVLSDADATCPSRDDFIQEGEFNAKRWTNNFIQCSFNATTLAVEAEWVWKPSSDPKTFKEAGWNKQAIIKFCSEMEQFKPAFNKYVDDYEKAKTAIAQLIKRLDDESMTGSANAEKARACARCMTLFQLNKCNFSITVIQKAWKLLGKIHYTLKEALYHVTLEENQK